MAQNGTRASGPRCIALVGPFQSGKTTLLEAILARTGAIARQGTVEAGNTVGDASKEARHHRMSVEISVATTNFMGDDYTFVDCPGSVEFVHDMRAALPAVDAAVVVCEVDEKKIPQLQLILRELEELKIPRFLFLNKIDKADEPCTRCCEVLQPASRGKLLLRQIPMFSGEIITGFIDLALERAFVYKEHAPSEVIDLEGDALDQEKKARFSMLETLADHDNELMEQLLEDIQPPRDKIFDDLSKELRESLVCPVLIGTATRTNGVLRLMKALRHESPGIADTAKRLGVKAGNDPVAYVLKTLHTSHGGKMSIARVLNGQVADSTTFITPEREAGRVAGVFKLLGQTTEKRGAGAGRRNRCVRQARSCRTGDTLTAGKQAHPPVAKVAPYAPVLAIAVTAKERKDDVKLGQALHKLLEEDPSVIGRAQRGGARSGAWGQGEMHLRVATERLADRFGVAIASQQADRRLSRDHQERHRPARPPQEAVGRPRPVRRRGARHQAAAARLGFHLRRGDQGRRGAAQLHSLGRGGRHRRAQARPARLPGGRCRGQADRRLVSHRRFLRHGVPHRRPHRLRGVCRSASRCCWSRSTRSRSSALRRRPPR